MQIGTDDASYLLTSIKNGRAMLVLGAGASVSSTNSRDEPIKSGWKLAEALCLKAGLKYSGELLTEVLGAVRGQFLSDVAILEVLNREYKNCAPSKELTYLLSYTWRRIYTWNIDDALENVNQRTAQNRSYFNGMDDKAVEFEGYNKVHIVHLHGDINKPDKGFILTEQEYSNHIKSDKHYWYQRAAQDYLSTCPIFIGSQLAEPILAAELERAKRQSNSESGRAYLIVPGDFTPIQKANYASKGIVHLKGTLEEFSAWLQKNLPGGWSAKDVISATNKIPEKALDNITHDELTAANSVRVRDPKELRTSFQMLRSSDRDRSARQFLQGFPPSWSIAASKIPVWLDAINDLYKEFSDYVNNNNKLFVVSGQAGSGKTTAAMMVCLKYAEENNLNLYELDPNVRSVGNAFRLLKRIKKGKAILYIGDLFVYGDLFKNDLDHVSGEDFIIVSTSRSGEWNEHHKRYLGDHVTPFAFQRFSSKDYDPLIERLTTYVPSPTFRKLNKKDQYARLNKSNSQLLIALREATGSENFNLIIANEFEGLPDESTKRLFVIVGLATIARVGISRAMAREAYEMFAQERSFEQAIAALEGIVSETEAGRLLARHELYVRHVLEGVTSFPEISAALISILRTFVKFNIPVIKSVGKVDGVLFRSLINHHFILQHAQRHKNIAAGLEIYESFEVDFQLDGHYWLQYGLYLADIPRLIDAGQMLGRSIDAYPGNAFAVHALADIELRIAKSRASYDATTRNLIDKAVVALLRQDAQSALEIDRYPIVTLTNGHISCLIRHRQFDEAKRFSRQYFERIKQIERSEGNYPAISKAKERLLKFISLGEWEEQRGRNDTPGNRKRKSRGRKKPSSSKIAPKNPT